MKKLFALLLIFVLMFSLAACGEGEKNEVAEKAIHELERVWKGVYQNTEGDGYFEIKNTRIITIKEDTVEEFEGVDYIVEFVLFTDYFDSAPYYSSVGVRDSVILYDDGEIEVCETNPLRLYSSKHYTHDYSDIIEKIEDCGDKYNRVENLK